MKYPRCEKCGCARRDDECRLCWLTTMTSQDVIWHEQERVDYTAEGEAIGSCEVWSTLAEVTPSCLARFNSTENTAATSEYLPSNDLVAECPRCHRHRVGVVSRRQNTAYYDDESNWATYCGPCQEVVDDLWQDQWDEYYASRL